ncbi:ABC transporter ATP-binding protein [Paenibacillus pasadenensis]|uniref:ABC-type nitrate/sulfonate/bicarbonate transport system, ATPase component n=1 Tax=Paenibacillus pasadenensis TaxID=217090 RepID=A0A2N5NAP3_9BACL|nr:ABC-type nitrate/sulfonate/bicarbonate transport system, ATPase component [Paenibacillus pasadenensis]
MTVKIEARGIRMAYASGRGAARASLEVLQDFGLQIREGEFMSVLGPSGCGKSTFLGMLAGLAKPTEGVITVDGQPLTGVSRRNGVVFQGYALFPWRTVLHNVETGLQIRGVRAKERREKARHYIRLVGLEAFEDRYPHELSGGMKQRVAIARALAYDPDVLLMDEPFGALDAQTRETMQAELLRIWEASRKTIVFITHSLDEAVYLSDRVAVMTARPGRVKAILDIPLERPRPASIRGEEAFVALRRQAAAILQDEVEQTDRLLREEALSGAGEAARGHEAEAGGRGKAALEERVAVQAGAGAVEPDRVKLEPVQAQLSASTEPIGASEAAPAKAGHGEAPALVSAAAAGESR